MSTTELKYGLHQIIDSINDSKTLQTIFTILSDKASSSTTLTQAEKKPLIQP